MGATSVESNMNKQATAARPWSLLHMCSLEQWKNGHAEAAGFSETSMTCSGAVFKDCSPTFCMNRQGIININKSSSVFSFRRKNKFTKMAEHFEYNHIPAQLSSIQNFHVKSVLCYHDQTVILHLVRNMMTQFGIINLSDNKFIGVFGKQSVEFVNEALRGQISPDGNYCILKIPSIRNDNASTYVYQMYDLKSREMLHEISLAFHHSLFAFDPRFTSSRIAATSFQKGEDNSLSLVQTSNWEVLSTNSKLDDTRWTLHPTLKDLFYSKDGNLIFAVMVTDGCHCRERKARRYPPIDISVYIFNSDNAQTLRCVQYSRYTCGTHSCPVNFLPVFSNCGSRMAIVLNEADSNVDHLQIYKLPTMGSLQNRCRVKIMQVFSPELIPKLPLPARLIHFLQYKPEYG